MNKITIDELKVLAYESRYGLAIGASIVLGLILGGVLF